MTFLIFVLLVIIAFAVAPRFMLFLAEISVILIGGIFAFVCIIIGALFILSIA